MKENKYDDKEFFEKYSKMERSVNGLQSAGEWHELKKLLPDFNNKRVLDLGCGFGWHCIYAAENGAKTVTGVDISKNMLEKAMQKTKYDNVKYVCSPLEDFDYQYEAYDVVLSSLTFHYIKSFDDICKKVSTSLVSRGNFVFSAEHPVFTAFGTQDWDYDEQGNKKHWPVDSYFIEGKRNAVFLGENVIKYHRTLTTYLNTLIKNGFEITAIVEPMPSEEMLAKIPEMKDELRRPMMLLISAVKK